MSKVPVTISQAAHVLRVSESSARRFVDTGALEAIRLSNGTRLIDADSLERLARERAHDGW
jgi:excisionase family DNA binding protein